MAIIDVASRKVLAWRLSNTLTADFCVEALEEALKNFRPPEIFNTDQGSQFTCEEWLASLKAAGVAISMDGKGRWIDNVFIERLWRNVQSLAPTQPAAVLGLATDAIGLVWSDHLGALLTQLFVERITVVSTIADQVFRLGFDHVKVERQLHERDFVVVRGVRRDGERQAVPIHDRHDFHAFSAPRRPNLLATTFGRGERGIDITLRLVDVALLAQRVGQIRRRCTDDLVLAPLLKAAMHRLVVRVGLRKHVPLRAGVQNPQRRLEYFAGWNRLAARTIVGVLLLRKMLPDQLPLHVRDA
jgi:hypothetical protein